MEDVADIRAAANAARAAATTFFGAIPELDPFAEYRDADDADVNWRQLDTSLQTTSITIQRDVTEVARVVLNLVPQSPMLSDADARDVGKWTKSLRAALRLREYSAWDPEVLHDEGTILGVRPSGQSDGTPSEPARAHMIFDRTMERLLDLIDLLDVAPKQIGALDVNPQSTASYEPNTAFIMMAIDARDDALEDLCSEIKNCFQRFGIAAVRADDIEHQDIITEKITERIKKSEFLLADLSTERPSVYYEVGYAHALGRKVILYRRAGSRLHFDLQGYNCPEYRNLTNLRELLKPSFGAHD